MIAGLGVSGVDVGQCGLRLEAEFLLLGARFAARSALKVDSGQHSRIHCKPMGVKVGAYSQRTNAKLLNEENFQPPQG